MQSMALVHGPGAEEFLYNRTENDVLPAPAWKTSTEVQSLLLTGKCTTSKDFVTSLSYYAGIGNSAGQLFMYKEVINIWFAIFHL